MPTITVENVPPDLYERLKQHAEVHQRSIDREIIACIESAISEPKVHPKDILRRARKLREKTEGYVIADDEFTQAKVSGRL